MSWQAFDAAAPGYEAWYLSPRGRRASFAERRLLERLLGNFPDCRSALDIGCGTGHFTRWLAGRDLRVIGLDRSAAMLAQARRACADIPLVHADAARLPLHEGCVDLAVFVTTLEFLDSPRQALAEAARVARAGMILLVLNRHSAGAISRRIGAASRGSLLHRAHDYALSALVRLVRESTAPRLRTLHWSSTLFPPPLHRAALRLPLGDILGLAAVFEPGAPPNRTPLRA
jgi:ubiquinone/menaquinone biosynthesis C-methylase UbiE